MCSKCKNLGHGISQCRRMLKGESGKKHEELKENKNQQPDDKEVEIKEIKQQQTVNGRGKPKEQERATPTSNSYTVLAGEMEIGSKSNQTDNIV